MKAPNHLAGGIVITGFFATLCGINIFSSANSLVVLTVGALFPDIDHPKSLFGRALRPVSLAINRRWGHRTITHSAPALTGISFIFALVEKQISASSSLALIFFLAYWSHLLLDMVTVSGIPLLYPFSKNPFVMPANPRWRIKTGDIRAETIAFCLFLFLAFWMKPLFKQGFWTTYNRAFGTLKHLASEFRKSSDLLEVTYQIRRGSEIISGSGLCVEASDHRAVLIENDRFTILEKDEMVILHLLPAHSGRSFFFERVTFDLISPDSLNRLLSLKQVTELTVSGSRRFGLYIEGTISETSAFKGKFPNHPRFMDLPPELTDTAFFIYEPNPRIAVLETRLRMLEQQISLRKSRIKIRQDEVSRLESAIDTARSIPEKERLFHRLDSLRKAPYPTPDESQSAELVTEIRELRRLEKIKNLQRKTKPLPDESSDYLSGSATLVIIASLDKESANSEPP